MTAVSTCLTRCPAGLPACATGRRLPARRHAQPFNGWDQFTRPTLWDRGDAQRWAALLNATGADGSNADSESGDSQNDGVVHLSEDFYTTPSRWGGQWRGNASGPSPENPVALNRQAGIWVPGWNGGRLHRRRRRYMVRAGHDKRKWMIPVA